MKKILIVDDSFEFRKLMQIALSDLDYELLFASSGSDALNTLNKMKIDLVISDLEMPNGTGRWLLKESRKLMNAPKIVIMSGDITASEESLKAEGALAFLRKPFRIPIFTQFVKNVMTDFS